MPKHNKSTSVKSITQRTNSSIDQHITLRRQLWNDIKTNQSKLEKIVSDATESVSGFNPVKPEYQPFPIHETYRYKKVICEESDGYNDTAGESSPVDIKQAHRSHTIMHSSPSKLGYSTMYKHTHTIDNDAPNNSYTYSNFPSVHQK